MTDESNIETKTPIRFTYRESIELAKLYDEAELAFRKRGFNFVHYPWYDMAKVLEKKGLCQITEELNQYGRFRWRLVKLANIDWTKDPIDPSETIYQDEETHKKRVYARRFLIDTYKKM